MKKLKKWCFLVLCHLTSSFCITTSKDSIGLLGQRFIRHLRISEPKKYCTNSQSMSYDEIEVTRPSNESSKKSVSYRKFPYPNKWFPKKDGHGYRESFFKLTGSKVLKFDNVVGQFELPFWNSFKRIVKGEFRRQDVIYHYEQNYNSVIKNCFN